MRLALLGANVDTPALAAAIAARPGDELVAVCDLDARQVAEALAGSGLLAPELESWEGLLDPEFVDAVIVAESADEDRRADQLRKFAQAAMPVLVAHPLFSSMLVYYELDMIRRDTHAVLLPYLPDRWHPASIELARLFQEPAPGSLGRIEQVVFERHLLDRGQPAVSRQFARDVDMLRAIGGEVLRLHAMGPAVDSSAWGNLNVQLAADSGMLARWSVVPADDKPWGRLTLLGSSGRAALTMPADGAWSFELSVAGNRLERQLEAARNPAEAALDRLARAIDGETIHPDWLDAARSCELTETIPRSLKKGRTIDLHYEDYTEASTFKGTMAALGCGMLMLGLILLVAVAVIEDFGRAVGQRIPLLARWPYLLLGLLGFFLALQLLLLALKRDKPSRASDEDADLAG